jgi:sulfatase maturation enzyme AslB (radical SAM superfamily)
MLLELMKLPYTRELSVNSNGSTPEYIETICREVCESADKPLHLQLSVDGLEERHDDIRKIRKGFKKVLDTCERAARLKESLRNFNYVVAITVMNGTLASRGRFAM